MMVLVDNENTEVLQMLIILVIL